MKHIKSIIVIISIIFITGFFVRHIMWMKEVGREYKVDQLSDRVNQKKEVNDKNIKDHKEKIKNTMHIDGEEPIVVKKSQALEKQSGKSQHKRENPENVKIDISAQLPGKETKLSFEEEAVGSTDSVNREYIDEKNKNYGLKPDLNKTMSITKKNNTISITLKNKKPVTIKNTSPPKHMKALNGKVGSNTQHSTSTIPQW
ncbi:MAG TPA: hypothetical protein ENH01_01245 [Nitrospirae bacterium]|nr:hypothetical protein [Nitrospirota bacterium]